MMHIEELDTPALIVDLDIMDRNLARVAEYTARHGLRLRPHTKTHKIPALARRQLELGAIGVTVAKVGEAEVMLESGSPDLLVAYPVIGQRKLDRLMAVAERTQVTVSLDSEVTARELSQAARTAGTTIGVLAEIDVGLGRVGVETGPRLSNLASEISRLPNLCFQGVAFYPGHIKSAGHADTALQALSDKLDSAVSELEQQGFEVSVVSGGSTPALFRSHLVRRMNEIRPGTYIFNDRNTWLSGACELSDCAASILATVVSTAVKGQAIIDAGSKTFSSDRCSQEDAQGFGYFPDAPDAELAKMNEEHGFVNVAAVVKGWRVGDRARIIPNHICVAVNLHERIYGVRGEHVEEIWEVKARGKLQ
jgi:D-serine deaminase-like pyridoxal phosphate-dependent protein